MKNTILIVDDFTSTRNITKFTLQKAGYHVLEASGRKEALSQLNIHSISLIIADLNISKMDGLALVREIRLHPLHQSTPILVPGRENLPAEDKTEWIAKPYTVENFLNTVQKVIK